MSDGTDSDLRRRAAWLLGMLVVVAVLFVVIMTVVIGTSGGDGTPNAGKTGPLDSAVDPASSTTPPPSSTPHSSAQSSSSSNSTGTLPGTTSCPTTATCVLTGDVGNAIAAVNAYRTQNGQSAVAGSVGAAAQTCALNNGNGCSGGWAETEVSTPNGAMAVQRILQFGKLLDPALKNFQVGWAYDPGAKLYYFAIIRND